MAKDEKAPTAAVAKDEKRASRVASRAELELLEKHRREGDSEVMAIVLVSIEKIPGQRRGKRTTIAGPAAALERLAQLAAKAGA